MFPFCPRLQYPGRVTHSHALVVFILAERGTVDSVTNSFDVSLIFLHGLVHGTFDDLLALSLREGTLHAGRSGLDAHVRVARAAAVAPIGLADLCVAFLPALSRVPVMLVPSAWRMDEKATDLKMQSAMSTGTDACVVYSQHCSH